MADTMEENPIVLDIMRSYGAIMIGCCFSSITWGVSSMHLFLYLFNYEKDHWTIKLLVLFVWGMDTAREILVMKAIFLVLIQKWGRVAGLSETQPGLIHHMWISGIIAATVQMYFLWRIYKFDAHRALFLALLLPIMSWQIIGPIHKFYLSVIVVSIQRLHGTVFSITTLGDLRISIVLDRRQIALTESLQAVGFGVDIILAIAMTHYLIKNGQFHLKSESMNTGNRLIFDTSILTVNAGIWTTFCAFMALITLLVFPRDFFFHIFDLPTGGLYVSSLLANLNTRRYFAGANANVQRSTIGRGTSVQLTTIYPPDSPSVQSVGLFE